MEKFIKFFLKGNTGPIVINPIEEGISLKELVIDNKAFFEIKYGRKS